MTAHNAMIDLERLDAAQAWVGAQAVHSEQVEAPALIMAILYEWKRWVMDEPQNRIPAALSKMLQEEAERG